VGAIPYKENHKISLFTTKVNLLITNLPQLHKMQCMQYEFHPNPNKLPCS